MKARILTPLSALLAVAVILAPVTADATPGFARQTGISCQACHTVFPELTPFGRQFKMNAYVFTNVQQLQVTNEQRQRTLSLSDLPPLSVMLQASNTTLGKSIPDTGVAGDLSQQNDTQFPQALSLFYTGKVAPYLGSFLQLTWEPDSDSIGIDNSEVRFANHGTLDWLGLSDFIYGLTLNNNPTAQDVWNSTPAWGYPFISTNVGVPADAQALLDGQLSQEAAGLGVYLYLFNHLYLELSGYRSAQTSFTNTTTGGPGPLDSTAPAPRISGVAAPYWRVAWQQDWGNHSLSLGTYGMSARLHPPGIGGSGPVDTYTDVALDGQYQFIGERHIFSAYATWIHEDQKHNNLSLAENRHDHLDTLRLTGSYFYRRMIGGSVQFFSTTGSRDTLLYPDTPVVGSASGSPKTQGATVELDYLPWLNTKLGVQYTGYTTFNGRGHNYDGAGRSASDNNTVYVFAWIAF
jgi:hypothetical protein